MIILALETSCDETSAAIVRKVGGSGLPAEKGVPAGGFRFEILSNVVSSQIELHQPYGGVVPELASRQHLLLIQPVVRQALAEAKLSLHDLDAIAATYGPGLASSLLIGLTAAKAIAVSIRKPFLAINHMAGHLWSPFLRSQPSALSPHSSVLSPHVSLIVSGGHTMLLHVSARGKPKLLGQTLDDAAGEAFDKVAKLLGLGYPGGPEIDRLARTGNPNAIKFPRGLLNQDNFNFSFSGVKTAVLYHLKKSPIPNPQSLPAVPTPIPSPQSPIPDLCASFQEAVVDVLVQKTLRAAVTLRASLITVSGGVACNSRLREKFTQTLSRSDAPTLHVLFAEPQFCTDNAAMIAAAAFQKLQRPSAKDLHRDAEPSARLIE